MKEFLYAHKKYREGGKKSKLKMHHKFYLASASVRKHTNTRKYAFNGDRRKWVYNMYAN